jgi:hypothetical protein
LIRCATSSLRGTDSLLHLDNGATNFDIDPAAALNLSLKNDLFLKVFVL